MADAKLWIGAPEGIIEYDPATGDQLTYSTYTRWGPVLGGLVVGLPPLSNCRAMAVDSDGRQWVLTDDGPVVRSAGSAMHPLAASPGPDSWHWASGYIDPGDGNDRVYIGFWQVMAELMWSIESLGHHYGAPTDMALSSSGRVLFLSEEGHILTPPRPPDLSNGALQRWLHSFAELRAPDPDHPLFARTIAFDVSGNRIAIAGVDTASPPALATLDGFAAPAELAEKVNAWSAGVADVLIAGSMTPIGVR